MKSTKDGVAPWLEAAFEALSRDKERSLEAFLTTVDREVDIQDTRARCHCHFVLRVVIELAELIRASRDGRRDIDGPP